MSETRPLTDEEWGNMSANYFLSTGQPLKEELRSSIKIGPVQIVVNSIEERDRQLEKGLPEKSIVTVMDDSSVHIVRNGQFEELELVRGSD